MPLALVAAACSDALDVFEGSLWWVSLLARVCSAKDVLQAFWPQLRIRLRFCHLVPPSGCGRRRFEPRLKRGFMRSCPFGGCRHRNKVS